jgi:hypothetical protein
VVIRWFLVLAAAGCADEPCPEGSMLASEGGLVVTEAEHPLGWGSAECTDCHALPAIHLAGCTPEVDLVEAREEVDLLGLDSCATCHGDNGVTP